MIDSTVVEGGLGTHLINFCHIFTGYGSTFFLCSICSKDRNLLQQLDYLCCSIILRTRRTICGETIFRRFHPNGHSDLYSRISEKEAP